tara:strand:- start:666 stop:1004 length:339 start_codon:yes stop_codon:yes gene_type:complete
MNYEHKPSKTTLELWNSKGSLFQNGKLLFRGDGYIAIKMFVDKTGNAPEVVERFKSQLTMREEVKWKKRDEEVKAKEKAKADKMKDELENSKKEKVIRRPKTKNSKIDSMFS